MSSPLNDAGAISESSKFAPIYVNRPHTGLWTQRNPLRDAAVPFIYEKQYGAARFDSLLDGLNAEITAKLTLARRPGHSVYNSATFGPINRFYDFPVNCSGTRGLRVIADEVAAVYDATGPSTRSLIFTKGAGAGPTFFQHVGNILYMGDGVETFKWNYCQNRVSTFGAAAPTDAPTTAPLAFVGAPTRYWAPAMTTQAGYAILDSNGNIELLTGNPNVAQSFQNTIRPAVSLNGSFPANTPITPVGGVTINAFQNPGNATDGNPNDFAGQNYQHTRQYAVCTWTFPAWTGATAVSIDLNILSAAQAPISTGTGSTAMFVSIDGGTTYTQIYRTLSRNKQWDRFVLSPTQDMTQVLVFAFLESHDDGGVEVYDINAVVGTATISTVVAGSFTTGTAIPKWNTALFGLTTDGTAIWLNCGAVSQWRAKTVFSLAGPIAAILDGNGNLQVVQSPGVSGAAQPTWNTAPGQTTTDGTVIWLNAGPGATAAAFGWKYGYAFHFTDGHVTTMSPASSSTGPVLGVMDNADHSAGVYLSGAYCADANCDKIWLFRTADDGVIFLLDAQTITNVPASAGTTPWAFVDHAVDDDLNELLQAAIDGDNAPPPAGLIALEYHKGRMWGAKGTVVSFSRTPNAALVGSALESFPPANTFTYPSDVIRLVSTTQGLLVFTTMDVFIIIGNGTDSDPFRDGGRILKQSYGLLHYDALTVSGSTIYMLDTTSMLISLDPGAGVNEPGFPIGDQFIKVTTGGFNAALYDPAKAFVTWHKGASGDNGLFAADGATGWFRMSQVAAPESGFIWHPFAAVVGGSSAVQSCQTAPGVQTLLVGPKTSGPILKRDSTVNKDNGTAFALYWTIGSIVLAHPGQLAELEFISADSVKVGKRPTLGLLLGELSGTFESLKRNRQEPPLLPPSKTRYNDRYYCSQNQKTTYCQDFQLKFTYPTEDAHNELLSYTIFGSVHNERRSQ